MTAHSKLGKSGIECFFGNPYSHHTRTPPKSNRLDRKPSKRILKNCDKMLKCISPQLISSHAGSGVEGHSLLYGAGSWELTMLL